MEPFGPLLFSFLTEAACHGDKTVASPGQDGSSLDSPNGATGEANPVDGLQTDNLGCAVASVTFDSLLTEMADLGRLARRPAQPYSMHLASSYDRSSVTPIASSDTPSGWYADSDGEII